MRRLQAGWTGIEVSRPPLDGSGYSLSREIARLFEQSLARGEGERAFIRPPEVAEAEKQMLVKSGVSWTGKEDIPVPHANKLSASGSPEPYSIN